MTAFGYGKPEDFSGYDAKYSEEFDFSRERVSGYIFDTTSKYIKVPVKNKFDWRDD
jgi:hypothetical protein